MLERYRPSPHVPSRPKGAIPHPPLSQDAGLMRLAGEARQEGVFLGETPNKG